MIHQYKLNGYNIVLDTGSASVHIVDDLAYDCIELFETNAQSDIIARMLYKYKSSYINKQDIENVLDDIRSLKTGNKLWSKEPDYQKLAEKFKSKNKIKALCLHIAHTCNLTCTYCFARGGTYRGEHELMSVDVGKQSIDFLVQNSGSRKNLEVDFFGGEPLMNITAVRQTVEYARQLEKIHNKKFRFTLTTNGILLDDDIINFLNAEMSNVVLSLDGRPFVHDRFRKTLNNKGSYDIVVPKFKELVKKRNGCNYYVRGTFTHHNIDFSEDIFHMADLGFKKLSMEPMVSGKQDPNALTDEDLPVLLEQYELLAQEMLKRIGGSDEFEFYHYNIDLENGPCIYKRVTGCGAGSEYLAVTPAGDLYPCHQFVGETQFYMGDVWNGVTNSALRDEFKISGFDLNPKCKDCWAKLYCSGGCMANAFHYSGSTHGVYDYGCELFRKRIECAIMLQAAKSLSHTAGNSQ